MSEPRDGLLKFWYTLSNFGTAEARHFKFGIQIDPANSNPILPPNGAWLESYDHLLKFWNPSVSVEWVMTELQIWYKSNCYFTTKEALSWSRYHLKYFGTLPQI